MNDIDKDREQLELSKVKQLKIVSKLIEEGNAGLKDGKVVDIRKHRNVIRISPLSPHARRVIFLSAVLNS